LQLYGSNREMANEARIARFNEFVKHGFMHRLHSKEYIHDLATEVEAIVGAVWIDSGRNWEVTEKCYLRIKDHVGYSKSAEGQICS
jgi:dsRNA-specific ribonuclease